MSKHNPTQDERELTLAVFLRVLEYYQGECRILLHEREDAELKIGILMLTTNQIAQFDVAVQSRIHIAIKYVKLNKEQTMDIFMGFLKPLHKQGRIKDMDDIEEWLKEDVVKSGFDGRQIRNIVTSAMGLARARNDKKLAKTHLKKVMNNVKEFKEEFIKQFEKYKTEQLGMIG